MTEEIPEWMRRRMAWALSEINELLPEGVILSYGWEEPVTEIDRPSPDCPRCGQPPKLLIGTQQAFCGNDDCDVLMWDPTKTRANLEANEHRINLETGETT